MSKRRLLASNRRPRCGKIGRFVTSRRHNLSQEMSARTIRSGRPRAVPPPAGSRIAVRALRHLRPAGAKPLMRRLGQFLQDAAHRRLGFALARRSGARSARRGSTVVAVGSAWRRARTTVATGWRSRAVTPPGEVPEPAAAGAGTGLLLDGAPDAGFILHTRNARLPVAALPPASRRSAE